MRKLKFNSILIFYRIKPQLSHLSLIKSGLNGPDLNLPVFYGGSWIENRFFQFLSKRVVNQVIEACFNFSTLMNNVKHVTYDIKQALRIF